jgi:hypothetical protein
MTDAQRDLFGFVGAALGVIVGLFVLQELYGSFADVRAHARLAEAGVFPEVAAAREAEAKKLASGRMPIDRAMRALAERGRLGFPSIAPKASDDLSAMSGWIHRHDFRAYEPRPAQVPAAPEPTPVPVDAPESDAPAATGGQE